MRSISKLQSVFIFLVILVVSGCKPERPDIGNVVNLGTVEEHVQFQKYPIYNCQSKVVNTVIAKRSRTLEQSIEVDTSIEFGSEQLTIVPYIGEIINKIGFVRGVTNAVSITDGGDLEMNAAPGTFPIYKIAWSETWENGYVTVNFLGEENQVPYRYLQFARPEISDIQYMDCSPQGLATATALARIKTPTITNATLSPKLTPTKLPTNTPTVANSWEFNTGENLEKWGVDYHATHSIQSVTVADGLLSFHSLSLDPYINSPCCLNIMASKTPIISIRMKVSAGFDWYLYFITSVNDKWEDEYTVQFPIIPDGNFHDYHIDMSQNSNWRGTVVSFRVDPDDVVADIQIDYIRVQSR